MRIEEIDMLIDRCQGSQPLTKTRQLVREFEQTCARIQRKKALQAAEEQLQQDVLLCEVMQAWTMVSKLTSLKVQAMPISDVAIKSLLIARHALEIASEELTRVQHPVPIRRVP
jgi:hypothetical protein